MTLIDKILRKDYGVNLLDADPITIIWACDSIKEKDLAKQSLKEANKVRRKYGLPIAHAPYGSQAF